MGRDTTLVTQTGRFAAMTGEVPLACVHGQSPSFRPASHFVGLAAPRSQFFPASWHQTCDGSRLRLNRQIREKAHMNIFATITSGTRAALLYITVGALLIVWSALYLVYLHNHPVDPVSDLPTYACVGFLLSGLTLFVIGVAVGWIGRSARQADQLHAVINSRDSLGNATQDVVPVTTSVTPPTPTVPGVAPPTTMNQPVAPQLVARQNANALRPHMH